MPTASKYEVRISNYAFFNLREIYQYISHIDFRPSVASEVVLAIENKILRDIACFPFYFPECPARKTRGKIYRQALCKNYKIIFKIDRETERPFQLLGLCTAHGVEVSSKEFLQNHDARKISISRY